MNIAKTIAKQKSIKTYGWKERDYQLHLANILGGNLEVRTPIGRIDIINNDLLIEVKFAGTHSNKMAIGQALCYTYFYPGYKPCIALIGEPENAIVAQVCREYGIVYLFFWNGIWQLSP